MSGKKDRSGSGALIAGLIGVGLGLLGGFIASKLTDKPVEKPQYSQVLETKITRRSKNKNESDEKFQQMMVCPITLQMMVEPMTIPQCGHSFEKKAIADHLAKHQSCPICRKATDSKNLVPNYQLKNLIDHYKQTRR